MWAPLPSLLPIVIIDTRAQFAGTPKHIVPLSTNTTPVVAIIIITISIVVVVVRVEPACTKRANVEATFFSRVLGALFCFDKVPLLLLWQNELKVEISGARNSYKSGLILMA